MPRPKRWFPLSHDVNDDHELWDYTTMYGDRALRTWLEILSQLDRTENHLPISDGWFTALSRKVRQSVANCRRQVRHLVATQWLTHGEPTADEPRPILSSRNYWKYHKRWEPKRILQDSAAGACTGPLLSYPIRSEPSEEKEKKKTPLVRPPKGAVLEGLHGIIDGLIGFLNERTGKHFLVRHPNGEPTKAYQAVSVLLTKGYSELNIRQVIANRCLKWRDDQKMQEFLRPETLFRPSNFSNYVGELGKE